MNASRRLGSTGPAVFPLALGCMGMSGMYGPADEEGEHRHHPRGPRSGRHSARYRRFLWHGPQRNAPRPRAPGPPRPGPALREVRRPARSRWKLGRLRRPSRRREEFPGLHPQTPGHGPRRHLPPVPPRSGRPRSRRPSAPSPIWSRPATSAPSASPKWARKRSAAPMPSIPSPISRSSIRSSAAAPEARIFPVLAELGIGVTAYGVLSRGLLCGSIPSGPADFRAHFPRFQPANLARNRRLLETLQLPGRRKGRHCHATGHCLGPGQGRNIVPVVGARTPAQLAESLAAIPRLAVTRRSGTHRIGHPSVRRRRRPLRAPANANAR